MREIDPHLPVDKTAAFVVSKSNEQGLDYKCGNKIYSMMPLPTRQFPGLRHHNLTGQKCGSFIVIGCALWVPANYLRNRSNTIRWVVKCKCGRYGMLTTRAVKKNHPNTQCDECAKVASFKNRNSLVKDSIKSKFDDTK